MTLHTQFKGILNEDVRQMIFDDPELFAKVALASGKKTYAAIQMVTQNRSKDLESIHVVRAISEYTGRSEEQILFSESSTN